MARYFEDIVEVILRHEALIVPLTGEALVVLSHQFGVFLVGVYSLAEVDKLVVVVEAAEVDSQTAEQAIVVLAVSTDIDRRISVAGVLVVGDSLLKFLNSVVLFLESFFDSWSDVDFSEL